MLNPYAQSSYTTLSLSYTPPAANRPSLLSNNRPVKSNAVCHFDMYLLPAYRWVTSFYFVSFLAARAAFQKSFTLRNSKLELDLIWFRFNFNLQTCKLESFRPKQEREKDLPASTTPPLVQLTFLIFICSGFLLFSYFKRDYFYSFVILKVCIWSLPQMRLSLWKRIIFVSSRVLQRTPTEKAFYPPKLTCQSSPFTNKIITNYDRIALFSGGCLGKPQ